MELRSDYEFLPTLERRSRTRLWIALGVRFCETKCLLEVVAGKVHSRGLALNGFSPRAERQPIAIVPTHQVTKIAGLEILVLTYAHLALLLKVEIT